MFLLSVGLVFLQACARVEIETLQKQLSNMQHMNEKALQDLATSEEGKVEVTTNVDTLQENNNKLRQDLEHFKSQTTCLQAELKHQREETAVLAEQLETCRNTEYHTRQKLEEVEDELSRAKLETENLEKQNTNYRHSIEASNFLYKFCIMIYSYI
jgi:predicted nuclease with TOPRIM domain